MTERGLRAASGRRIAAVIAMGALALGAMSACRSDSGTAAFVGSTRITNNQISSFVGTKPITGFTTEGARQTAVTDVVFIDLAERYAAAHGYGQPPAPAASDKSAAASSLGVKETNGFLINRLAANGWNQFLLTKVSPVTPTDAELRDIYNRAVTAKLAPAGQYDQVKTQIAQVAGIGNAVALQRDLTAYAKSEDVTVNPRYALACSAAPCPSLYYPILTLGDSSSGQSFQALVVSFDTNDATPAVLDAPAAGS